MNKEKLSQQFYRPISRIILVLGGGVLFLVQWLPLSDTNRLLVDVIILIVGITAYVSWRYIIPRRESSGLIIYAGIIFNTFGVALADYLLRPLDLTPFYFLRIIFSAITSDRITALFAALLALAFQTAVSLLHGTDFVQHLPQLLIQGGSYLFTALLVSNLSRGLTAHWRDAAAVAQQRGQEIAQRKDELELLYEISQTFANMQDVGVVLRQSTERVSRILNGERCMIATLDVATGHVQGTPPGFGLTDAEVSSFHYTIRDELVAGWDMRSEQYFLSRDPDRLPRELREYSSRFHIHQIVAARMAIQGVPTGYIFVGNKTDGTSFTDSDARLLSILAEQIGIVVENARLYAELQTNLHNTARLYAISTEFLSRLDPNEIPDRVVASVAEALQAPIATIALLNENTGLLEYKAQIGMPKQALEVPFRKDGLGMTVVQSNTPRFIVDQDQVQNPSPATKLIGSRSVACLPIQRGDKRIGVLYVNYTEPHTFTPAEKNLLAIFANQTAIALENSQLYALEQQRATELDVIAEIGKHVTSILSLDELLPTLVHLVHTKFHYRYVHFFINDTPNQRTILRALEGPSSRPLAPRDFALGFDQGMVGWVASHGETLVTNDVSLEPRHRLHPDLSDTKSELAVPVKVGNEIIGVLDVQSEKLNGFEKTTVAMFETLAGQVAVAIENARLYGQLQDQARRDSLTQVFNHGYFIDRLNLQVGFALQDHLPISLIMLDIDHYKEYNDRYGHVVGDQVLTEIVYAIRANIKSTDIVGRWGGEEFGIVLPGANSERAHRVADRIRETLRATKLETKDGIAIIPPTVSQGISSIPEHTQEAATLIDLADAALYRAKNRGRDQIQIAKSKKIRRALE